jgi:ATP-dependent Lhr-like helicase
MPLDSFHPAVSAWFARTFDAPTPAQVEAWPAIRSGRNTLIAAPTGSGKTLAAFLASIDDLVRRGVEQALPDETAVVYVSPLKALSNDVRINLEVPLAGIRDELLRLWLPDVEIRTMVRTGDTPQADRDRMRKRPPHIVVTTPESLYILLGSESGRRMLSTTRTVIVDEVHALAPNKRGSHLALSLERLDALCGRRLTRIGLSATQKPIEEVAKFLTGSQGELPATESPVDENTVRHPGEGRDPAPDLFASGHKQDSGITRAARSLFGSASLFAHSVRSRRDDEARSADGDDRTCKIVDTGHVRDRDLAIELPETPLEAVMSGDAWEQVYARLEALIREHHTTLVFVNTRRMAERASRHLSERLGKDSVAAHHGSMAKELRFDAEQRLKRGDLKALVATASLELGIDIGDVDLVCQLGSPRSIAAFLQRVGRSNHDVGGMPKGRLFPQTRDELVESVALLDGVRRGELDTLTIIPKPLDVLAQQIVAEVACREWNEDELFELVRGAYPYSTLTREGFNAVVRMLADGYSTRNGQRSAYLHRDAVNGVLRARRGARLTAITSGGAIPDTADYDVVLEPQAIKVGTINEDFAVESLAGDIFQLGNMSYRILRVERGRVRVEDAQGAPPTIPFWLGEAPGRSDELSHAVSRFRQEMSDQLDDGLTAATAWLTRDHALAEPVARQIVDYLAGAKAALGVLPTHTDLAMERFFDESGGMQLIIHSPFGSRINRAWGLALRKRFCRTFNFELQAAATEDAIILSLSTSHSFPLEEVGRYLHSNTAREVLVQALLDAPMFGVRWRWNATGSLALPRFLGGSKVPPQLQRMKAEDLLATVFPDQVACAENLVGERQIPDHPLVEQTLFDCLHDAMDIEGLERLLRALESGDAHIVARDLTEPSPLAAEVLSARPYAYLDDAPLEERRTQAVSSRRWVDPATAADFGQLDADAIDAVREEAWPEARSADELHDALMGLGFVTQAEAERNANWIDALAALAANGRATRLRVWNGKGANARHPGESRDPVPLREEEKTLGSGFRRNDEGVGKTSIWAAAERLPQFAAVFADAEREPNIEAPAEFANVPWTREDALVEIIRSRLSGLGPVRVVDLAASLGVSTPDIDIALAALEGEGYVMRGQFTPGTAETEWCERRLLARIHRYTVKRLRREIEPVDARDFMRFLFAWQHVAPDAQVSGPDALAALLTQLEGYEAPAAAWESEILPTRVAGYEISWLDDLSRAGRVVWARLRSAKAQSGVVTQQTSAGPVRATPVVLLQRRHLGEWSALGGLPAGVEPALSSRARAVADYLRDRGASFFDELLEGTRLLHTELEDALGELVASGLVTSDSFSGLRALLVPSSKRPPPHRRRGRRASMFGIADAGRWAIVRRTPTESTESARNTTNPEVLELVARTLLKRYGVVCWRLLANEAAWLPPWRELLRVYHRLEARGEIRGGRFIAGLSGEQFALPEAVASLRSIRQKKSDDTWICVCGADPLNLVGGVLAGTKIPSVTGSRVLYRDGVPVAKLVAGEVAVLEVMDAATENLARTRLIRGQERGSDFAMVEDAAVSG